MMLPFPALPGKWDVRSKADYEGDVSSMASKPANVNLTTVDAKTNNSFLKGDKR